ncbi:homing endonuclease associated repeat-containing protein [Halobacteriaceae archaeon SHR40]|uniref:homing endonuclease associated repeat-containing protein n=1 Tax=Halovenus amylolytica TaxID=2500550 RepID=UPI000FE38479
MSETDHEQLLFYLAGRVPVPLQELAQDTKQSIAALREYFNEELQSEVDLDSTCFVRLMDSARNPVIRASKPYIKSGQGQFDAGQSSIDQDLFYDALEHFKRSITIFEEIQSRFESVNYASKKLNQRIETTRISIDEAEEAVGDSANRVETLLNDEQSDADSRTSPESEAPGSGTGDREAMLEVVRNLHDQLGRVPKTTELSDDCEYSPSDFYSEFGSWDETLEAAGIDKEQALLEDLERVAEKLGRVPSSTEMDEYGTYSGSTYSSYFESWSTALDRSRLEVDRDGRLLKTIRSLHKSLDRLPKGTDLRDVSGISQHDYIKNFGSWDEALEAAGIDKEQHLIDDLKQVAVEVGGKPRTTDADHFGEYSSGMHQKYFESWDAALEAADLSSMDTATRASEETEEEPSGTATIAPSTPIENITSQVDGVGRSTIRAVKKAGYNTAGELHGVQPGEITKYNGVGRTKAFKLVRFATECVSGNSASSGQSSNYRPSADQSSSSNRGANSNRVHSSALNSSWETIPANERIDGQFLLQVTNVDQGVGDRKTAQLDVRDQNGQEFKMNVWSKHDIDREWRENEWYALENARGKVWDSSDGMTRKQLSSTKDLNIDELGEDFDPNESSAEETSKPASTSQQPGATPDEDISETTPNSTTSSRDTVPKVDDEESSEDDGADNDGVLGDIMSDFDEI